MPEDLVKFHLTSDEALVLFEFVTRFVNDDRPTIEHDSERAALWKLHATLERVFAQPFHANYREALEAARERLARRAGTESK